MVGKEQNKNMSESLEKFTSIAKEDHQRAKTLFFSEAFKEEFLKDYELFNKLRPVYNLMNELAEGLQKTFTAVGSDTLVAALDVYASVKQNKDKVPGLSVMNDELATFFKKAKAQTADQKWSVAAPDRPNIGRERFTSVATDVNR